MCNLLPKHMDIYEINDDIEIFKGKVDNTKSGEIFLEEKIKKAKELIKHFEDQYREVYLETNTEAYLEKKGIVYVGLEKMIERYKESEVKDASVVRGVLVESDMLRMVLPHESYKDIKFYGHPLARQFLTLTLNSQAVICCRVAPKQKALVVRMIKSNVIGAITLSIGDGANDVSMITEADVGIGLYGEEGSQAAMSSDYACGDFKCLRRLVLFHGRLNYLRIGEMILYFFFKNFIFTIPQFFFAFYSGFSGMTLYDDWYVSLYNILFTALPLTVKALFEKDIVDPEEHLGFSTDNNFVSKQLSYTYYVGRESMIFNMERLKNTIIFSLCYSVMVFFAIIHIMNGCIASEYGYIADFWVGATTQFSAIILIVSYRIMITGRHFTIYNILFILLSVGSYIGYVVFSNYFDYSKSMGMLSGLVVFPQFYLSVFLISSIQFLIDFGISSVEHQFSEDPVSYLRKYEIDKEEIIRSKNTQQINEITEKCRNMIKDYDLRMKNKYPVKRVNIPE